MPHAKKFWNLPLYALVLVVFVVLSAQENGARKITTGYGKDSNENILVLRQHPIPMDDHLHLQTTYREESHEQKLQFKDGNNDDHRHHMQKLRNHEHGHSSSHMDHMDPALNVFFTTNDLVVGKTMPIYIPKKDLSASPRLLPREEADSIPFSISQIPYLLHFFSFSKDSPQAKAIEYTLGQCELEPINGETRLCATSLESMLEFARGVFGIGLDARFRVLTTTHLTNSTNLLQNYTILETPKQIFAPKMIACHTLPYPYAVFYCHNQESKNNVFEISLGGENGDRVEAAAVCHMDTSRWDRDHAAFSVLKIEPGMSPVCHFFPADNLVWLPLPSKI